MAERTVTSALPSRPLLSVAPGDSVRRAAIQMSEAHCGSAVVLEGKAVVGIVTERDILTKVVAKAVDADAATVDAVMTRNPTCAKPDLPVTHALYLMRDRGFRHLPVVDGGKGVLGIFSLRDALPEELAGVDELEQRAEHLATHLG